jgi:hypothetical protein
MSEHTDFSMLTEAHGATFMMTPLCFTQIPPARQESGRHADYHVISLVGSTECVHHKTSKLRKERTLPVITKKKKKILCYEIFYG